MKKILLVVFILMFSVLTAATTVIYPQAKGAADATNDLIDDSYYDDAAIAPPLTMTVSDNVYTIFSLFSTSTLYFRYYDTAAIPATATITNVVLKTQYGSYSGYSGTSSLQFMVTANWISTGITPADTSGAWSAEQTVNLFDQGVTNKELLATLNVRFANSGFFSSISFDYIRVSVTYYVIPPVPSVNYIVSPTSLNYQLITGTKDTEALTINVYCNTAAVGQVSYPTSTSFRVTISALAEGNNVISINAQNPAGTSNFISEIIERDSIAPATPNIATNGGGNFTTTNAAIFLSGSCSADSKDIFINGSSSGVDHIAGDTFWSSYVGLNLGDNIFNVSACDGALNTSGVSSITITLYTSPTPQIPEMPGIIDISTPTNNKSQRIRGTKDQYTTTINFYAASGTHTSLEYPNLGVWQTTLNSLNEGETKISVNAANAYGSSAFCTASIYVDTVSPATPSITTNGGINFTTVNFNVLISGICSEDTKYILVNGSAENVVFISGNAYWSYDAELVSGENNFTVQAVDLLDNKSGVDSIIINYDAPTPVKVIPKTKSASDTTNDLISDIVTDDCSANPVGTVVQGDRMYTVLRSAVMDISAFDISEIPTNAVVTGVKLYTQYGTQPSYRGSNYIQWRKSGGTRANTSIYPVNTNNAWKNTSAYDLFAQGVTNSAQIASLNIYFTNNSSAGTNRGLSFDYLWLIVDIVMIPTTPSITNYATPTTSYSQRISGLRDMFTTTVDVYLNGSSVGNVAYPSAGSWSSFVSGMNEGCNTINVVALNAFGSSGTASATVIVYNQESQVVVTKSSTILFPAEYYNLGAVTANPVPGSVISIVNDFQNIGNISVSDVVISDEVPAENTTYMIGSAVSSLPATINYQHEENGVFDANETLPVINIRWMLHENLAPGQTGTVTFNAIID